jgi:hypothetical protein
MIEMKVVFGLEHLLSTLKDSPQKSTLFEAFFCLLFSVSCQPHAAPFNWHVKTGTPHTHSSGWAFLCQQYCVLGLDYHRTITDS